MDTLRKLLILVVVIVLAVVLGPLALRSFLPSWAFDRDLAGGRVTWRPVYGVLVERQLNANLWEQFVVSWLGPGTIQVVEYVVNTDSDLLPNDGIARQRVGTKELNVTLNLERLYSIASGPDEFPVIIRQNFESAMEKNAFGSTGLRIDAPYGAFYFAEYAAVMLESPYRWGFKSLSAGDVVYLDHGRWSSIAGEGVALRSRLASQSYAGFDVLANLRLSQPASSEDRINSIHQIMLQTGGPAAASFPRDDLGTTVEFVRVPDDAALEVAIPRLIYSGDWIFPLPAELDLARLLARDHRGTGRVANAMGIGWGYSFPAEAMPRKKSMWFLRCLHQTEIAVPYTPPFS